MDETERDNEILREGPTRGKFTVWPNQIGIVMRRGKVVDIFSEGEQKLPRGEVRTYVVSTAPFHLTFWLKDPGDADQPSEGVALDQPVLTADGQMVTGRIDLTLSVSRKNVEYLLQLHGPRGTIAEQEVADAIKWELLAKVLALDLHKHTAGDLRGNRELFKDIFESLQIELTSTIRRYGLRLDNFYVNWGLTPEEQERIKEQRHQSIIRDIEREKELEELGGVRPDDGSSPDQMEAEPVRVQGQRTNRVAVGIAAVGVLAAIGFAAFTMMRSDDRPQQDTPAPAAAAPPTDTPTTESTSQTVPAAARPTAPLTMDNTSAPLPPAPNTPTPTNTPIPTATHTPTPAPTATHTPTPTNTPIPTATHTPTPTSTPVPVGRIAFSSSKDGSWDIHIMNPDGSGAVRMTDLPGDEYSPVWSPDGRKIAFRHVMEENSDIYVVNADGLLLTQLTHHPKRDTNPAWSPDSQRIAFQSDRDGAEWNIYVVNADGLLLTQLLLDSDYPNNELHPAWSPDGQQIAFSYAAGAIYVTNVDGSEVNNLSNERYYYHDYGPAWSPDGQRIAFWRTPFGIDMRDVYIMNADGSALTRLTNNQGRDMWPVWSPDGQRIAFNSNRDENWNIYVVNADGSSLARLTNDPQDDYLGSWSPDGQRIVFTRGSGEDAAIYVMNADGSGATSLGAGIHAVWSPE